MQLRDELPEIEKEGGHLIVVGNGTPQHAASFRDDHGLAFPLFSDPKLRAYEAAGLKRGVSRSFNFRTFKHAARAMKKGNFQKNLQGDPWQQGGVFVLNSAGVVEYGYISEEAGDHALLSEIMGALRTG